MNRLAFTIDGPPQGKGRPRHSAKDGVVRMHANPVDIALEKHVGGIVRAAFGARDPWTGPVRVTLTAVSAIPASWPKRYRQALANGSTIYDDGKPDGDNIEKLIWDACSEVVWRDDAQVAEWAGRKRYGEPERVEVVIEQLVDEMGAPPLPTPAQIAREKVTWAEVLQRKAEAKAKRKEAAKQRKAEAALKGTGGGMFRGRGR